MRTASFRALALSAFALLDACSLVAARPNTYVPYQLYDYQDLNTPTQRYWLLNPTENAPKDAQPVLFGAVRTPSTSPEKSSNASYEVDIQFPSVAREASLDTSITRQRNIVNLPLSSKPVLNDKELSQILEAYATQSTVQRVQDPPLIVPDSKPDAGLSSSFGNIGILIGQKVGGPIGIVIGSVIGYGIGSYIGGPIGDLIGSRLGVGMAQTLAAGSP